MKSLSCLLSLKLLAGAKFDFYSKTFVNQLQNKRWNQKKANVRFPKSFLEAYNVKETIVITPNNYLEWLTSDH